MFAAFPQSEFQIVAPDGSVRSLVKGIYSAKSITIPDPNVTILAGDELRRQLPNGTEEAFEVIDPVYHDAFHAIPAHYQVKIARKGAFPRGQGGNYNFTVTGPNARINFNSTDNSVNTHVSGSVFGDLRSAIEAGVHDQTARDLLLQHVAEMELAKDDKAKMASAYQAFITSAAEHITVIAPFLPALGQLFG